MTRTPRESLDYDTWLWPRAALTDDDEGYPPLCGRRVHIDGGYCGPCSYERGKCPDHPSEPDDHVPDEADTDPEFD
jgi:hypothetical protein